MTSRALLFLALLLASLANAEEAADLDCENALTTRDMEQCIAIESDKAEAALNQTYQRLVKQLTHPDTEHENYTEYRKKLLDAQRAWIKFRDADCDALYALNSSGSMRNIVYLSCKQQRAEQRTKELEGYFPG